MKKLFFALAITSALISCKKTSTTPNSTTNNSSNSGTCVDNPNINFTSIGTPIGKLDSCIKDIDGNVYKTVTIGTQTWMAENLKVSKYSDGTRIPNITDNTEWTNLTAGAWCYYDNDSVNNAKYGKLYNWYALSKTTNGNKNVCPSGWHVPKDSEWDSLIEYLGGVNIAGGKLKEVGVSSWIYPNNYSNNLSLFTATPGGLRFGVGGDYINIIYNSGFWTSSENLKGKVWYIYLSEDSEFISINQLEKEGGLSIRCLKD